MLPGSRTNHKMGCERWHKSAQFDWIKGQVPCLVEPKRPHSSTRCLFPSYPSDSQFQSLYPKKNNCELPSWIINDKQVLSFDAYFEDNFELNRDFKRNVKIHFFLEDGTIQVNEEKCHNRNAGLKGTLIGRRRIPFEYPTDKTYYEVIDLNVGKSVQFYGRTYFIVDCDKFTRHWLTRSGIAVPDPTNKEDDGPSQDIHKIRMEKRERNLQEKQCDKLGQFLKYDGHVLRFFGYWDDRESSAGHIHKLIVHYYLSDDTIDVREEGGSMLLARTRLPKQLDGVLDPGSRHESNLLNVLATGYLKGRFVKDSKNMGEIKNKYYCDADLLPGVTLNVYGRAIVITGCDNFTQDFYRVKYGIEQFKHVPVPAEDEQNAIYTHRARQLPPWNGFGTFEDSEANCVSLIPKVKPFPSFNNHSSRAGADNSSKILRFKASLISNQSIDAVRNFIVSFYLVDNTVSVFEVAQTNSGFESRMIIKRKEAFKPVENMFVSRKPIIYTKEDFWIGNTIIIDNFTFELQEADDFTKHYMQINPQDFPKSNIDAILEKIRSKLQHDYKSFIQKYLLPEGDETISERVLSDALKKLMGNDITPNEIDSLARHFSVQESNNRFDSRTIRERALNECRRLLFNGFDRLADNLREMDTTNKGYLPEREAYSLCRGAKIPLDRTLLNDIFDIVERNENNEISIKDLLSFFDEAHSCCAPVVPFSSFDRRPRSVHSRRVDCVKLIQSLNMEDCLKNGA